LLGNSLIKSIPTIPQEGHFGLYFLLTTVLSNIFSTSPIHPEQNASFSSKSSPESLRWYLKQINY